MTTDCVVLITIEEAVHLHAMVVTRFGGASGVRDIKLLESALDQPLKVIEYGEESEKQLEYLAATYFFHVIKNHAFVDGNKRTGLLVTITFLSRNGFALMMDHESLYNLAIQTAESKIQKHEIAMILKSCIMKMP